MKTLSFSVSDDHYLIDIKQVNSIVKKLAKDIRPLPEAPPFFVGLSQLREQTIGILSASLMFSKTPKEVEEYDVIIMIGEDSSLYGLIVDAVHGVLEFEDHQLVANSMMEKVNPYVLKVHNDGKHIHILIDADRLIDFKNVKEIKSEK